MGLAVYSALHSPVHDPCRGFQIARGVLEYVSARCILKLEPRGLRFPPCLCCASSCSVPETKESVAAPRCRFLSPPVPLHQGQRPFVISTTDAPHPAASAPISPVRLVGDARLAAGPAGRTALGGHLAHSSLWPPPPLTPPHPLSRGAASLASTWVVSAASAGTAIMTGAESGRP